MALIWNDQVVPDAYKLLIKKRNELLRDNNWQTGPEWDTWRNNCKSVVSDWHDYWTSPDRVFPADWLAGPDPRQITWPELPPET